MCNNPIYIDIKDLKSPHLRVAKTMSKEDTNIFEKIFHEYRSNTFPEITMTLYAVQDCAKLSPELLKQMRGTEENTYVPDVKMDSIDNFEKSLPIIKEIVSEWKNRQQSAEYSKIGISICGKLFVFRRVSNFKENEDDFEFDIKIKRYKEWVYEHVTCRGVKVFAQKTVKEVGN